MAYGGGWLDRAGALRADPGWVAARLADRASVVLPLWRDRCLVGPDRTPLRRGVADAAALLAAADETVFLGLDADSAVFAVDLSARAEPEARRAGGGGRGGRRAGPGGRPGAG